MSTSGHDISSNPKHLLNAAFTNQYRAITIKTTPAKCIFYKMLVKTYNYLVPRTMRKKIKKNNTKSVKKTFYNYL
jgi:hypothetical protein